MYLSFKNLKNAKIATNNLVTAFPINDKIIVTSLPKQTIQNGLSVKSYSLSVTNTDETSASNSVNYYIYDSTCHLKSVNKTEFTLKVEYDFRY